MGASTGAAYAVANPGVADVKITQQNGACTGVVVDATGETVIGASVVVKGYQTVEIPWDGQPMNVTLQDDTQTLGEVVVTALGIK
eukprot:6165344-Prorocentrum_lima.AAC.1